MQGRSSFPVDVRQARAEELYELERIGTGIAFEERTANPTYKKPAHLSLPRVKEHMKVKVHVSPEQGWPVLKEFLERTKDRLTVAMYDFGAKHKGLSEAFEVLPPIEPDADEAAAEIRVFDPLDIDRVVDVQPILTPDNYVEKVLPLIESATSRLYFQNQYINESLDPRAQENFIPLVEAIARKQQQGLDVRIVLRGENGVEARHIEFLKTHGIDLASVRWRNRTHTKGIIVDSARVLLGSHNWSLDGTVLNRDASLLFFDAEIAKYLEKIFIYDWENWSKTKVSIKEKKPKVNEVASVEELAALKKEVESGDFRVRRLFRADD